MTRIVNIGDIEIGGERPFVLIAGPCVIEGEKVAMETGAAIKKIAEELKIPYIYKSSYDKANRSSVSSYRGPGMEEGLKILKKVREYLGVPVLSDVHTVDEVRRAAEVLDVLQIPAFLCRQTDLLLEAGRTKKPVNVKKGQFLAPEDIINVVDKIESEGNKDIILTERGATFGYHNLVVDFRSLQIMREGLVRVTGGVAHPLKDEEHPAVVFDATHSVQLPGGADGITGGDRRFIPTLARAAVASGVDGIFMEVHPDPPSALCDATNQFHLKHLKRLLEQLFTLDSIIKNEKNNDFC
ncbi:MAG: 3-deoxy-8-phosphooctulonate synthase [Deltaproteobacteria bacterium]|uniref:2-dehydro-3-deoxyphosphooctonate aldolase n=1 Tax=Candidatus Zymogenus saltonus TaxID=2844893 RepID=A0A9D8PPS2_9DELT|nr:3-deoxy-8-phosphooctulonate synthase [Candidatus Zymogenus saltonus]